MPIVPVYRTPAAEELFMSVSREVSSIPPGTMRVSTRLTKQVSAEESLSISIIAMTHNSMYRVVN